MTRSLLGRDIVTGYALTRSVSANTYTKIASGSMTGQYQDWMAVLLVTTHLASGPNTMLVAVYLNDGTSGAPTGAIELRNLYSKNDLFRAGDIVVVFTSVAAFAISWEMYLRFPGSSMDCEVTPLNIQNNGGTYQFYEEGALVGSLPGGTQVVATRKPWEEDSSGHFLPSANDQYDIGSGSLRPRQILARQIDAMGVAGSSVGSVSVLAQHDSVDPRIIFYRARDNAGAAEAIAGGDTFGQLLWYAWDGNSWADAGFIRSVNWGTPGDNDNPSAIEIGPVPDGSASAQSRWRFLPDGSFVPTNDGAAAAAGLAEVGAATARVRRVNSANLWQPFAYHLDFPVTPGANEALATVAAGNGGALILPMVLSSPMLLQSISIINGDTASARACEMRLYADNGDATIDFVTGTDCTLSFTPSAVSHRAANVSGAPVYLPMGTYWLVIRNTSTTQTFAVRMSTGFAEWGGTHVAAKRTTAAAALGATIDPTAWTGVGNFYAARLNGRVFGQTTPFTGA